MDEQERSLAVALAAFLGDGVCNNDEFFDVDGIERVITSASEYCDGTATLRFEGFTAYVTIVVERSE